MNDERRPDKAPPDNEIQVQDSASHEVCPALADAQAHVEHAARLTAGAGRFDLAGQLERLAGLIGWEATRHCTCRPRRSES